MKAYGIGILAKHDGRDFFVVLRRRRRSGSKHSAAVTDTATKTTRRYTYTPGRRHGGRFSTGLAKQAVADFITDERNERATRKRSGDA